MKTFKQGQRVVVRQNAGGIAVGAVGEVARVRYADGGGWVSLDQRSKNEGIHPFPADDEHRRSHVMAYPEDCDPAEAAR